MSVVSSLSQTSQLPALVPLRGFQQASGALIIADITIEEDQEDRLTVTNHPVEQGAAITDHAYKEPARVSLRLGWSNSSNQAQGDPRYCYNIYQKLLALQASRVPFTVITGTRSYPSMLLTGISVKVDNKTENVLMVVATCQQIIIVSTSVVTVPPASAQQYPGKTAPVSSSGTVTPTAAPGSTSDSIFAGPGG